MSYSRLLMAWTLGVLVAAPVAAQQPGESPSSDATQPSPSGDGAVEPAGLRRRSPRAAAIRGQLREGQANREERRAAAREAREGAGAGSPPGENREGPFERRLAVKERFAEPAENPRSPRLDGGPQGAKDRRERKDAQIDRAQDRQDRRDQERAAKLDRVQDGKDRRVQQRVEAVDRVVDQRQFHRQESIIRDTGDSGSRAKSRARSRSRPRR